MDSNISLVARQTDERVDRYIHLKCPEISRTYIQKLIKEGNVKVNDNPVKANYKLSAGDNISVHLPPPRLTELVPQKIPLKIVYEDDDLLVIDKPAGLTVHPAPGHPDRTLVNAVLAHCPGLLNINDTVRPGIIHRLDKDTSGLIIVAKNSRAQALLVQQMKNREIVKKYLALVQGAVKPEKGLIEAPIGRHPVNRKKMAVTEKGRPARTSYAVREQIGKYSLVEITLETGRTHQIRVHFSATGFPVVGDAVYGVKSPFVSRQFLHSCYLSFKLPEDGRVVEFTSALPEDLEKALQFVRNEKN